MDMQVQTGGVWITGEKSRKEYALLVRNKMIRKMLKTHTMTFVADVFNMNKSSISRIARSDDSAVEGSGGAAATSRRGISN